jgi:hypothetical protein
MRRLGPGVILFCSLWLSHPLWAEIYQWVDEQGVVNFTDDYTKIPEKYRKKVSVKKTQPAQPLPPPDLSSTAPGEEQKIAGEQQPEKLTEEAKGQKPIEWDEEGHDRAWWQAQVTEWRQKLNQALTEQKTVEARYQVLVRQFTNPAFGQRGRRSLEGEVKALEDKLTQLQVAINEAKEKLEKELPAQAAEAGAPLEWLR